MVRLPLLESAIITRLETAMESIRLYITENKTGQQEYSRIREKLDAELIKLSKQKTAAYNLLERGVYTIETFSSRVRYLDDSTEQIKKQADELSLYLRNKKTTSMRDNYPANLLMLYNLCTPKEKNQILKSMVEQITYKKEKHSPPEDFALTIYVKFHL